MAEKSITLYHGTLTESLQPILKNGLNPSPGWVFGNQGVFLSSSKKGALYWAKMGFLARMGEKLDPSRFERKYNRNLLTVIKVRIPGTHLKNLRADMEQSEDFEVEIEENDWKEALRVMGDVLYKGTIPPEWITIAR